VRSSMCAETFYFKIFRKVLFFFKPHIDLLAVYFILKENQNKKP